ncbi:MAG: hypothetical protein R3F37_10695 [Candidatus Competibacteraceae bacterium]
MDKIGVKRGGSWFLDYNGNNLWDGCAVDVCVYDWDTPTDTPIVGDWNGDGIDEIGSKRGGDWLLDYNGSGFWDGCAVDLCIYGWGAPHGYARRQ